MPLQALHGIVAKNRENGFGLAGAELPTNRPGPALPHSRLRMDACAGTNRSAKPVDSVFLDGPLARTVEPAVAFVRHNTQRSLDIRACPRWL
jgi:hypothetical protein